MIKILIVDDEFKMRKILRDYFSREGFLSIEAEDGEEALDKFYSEKPDLVLLDIMMPKYDGWSICRKIREHSDTPIIILSARSEEDDEVFGLDLGADEYITKPFSPKVLISRIKAVLRRTEKKNGNTIEIKDLKIENFSRKVYLKELVLNLAPKEYELLYYMVEKKGIALSREHLLNKVWGYDYFGDLRTVDTHIKKLRKKIGEEYISTVRGMGYRFELGDE